MLKYATCSQPMPGGVLIPDASGIQTENLCLLWKGIFRAAVGIRSIQWTLEPQW